jgi:hypothetical protein
MNTKDLLARVSYAQAGDNVRRKSYPYYDTQTIAAGTTEYFFFVTAPGNLFLRNRQLPLPGSEIFEFYALSAQLSLNVNTVALANALNEILQQSYLEISVDNRVVCKLPGLDFINYKYGDTFTATAAALLPKLGGNLNNDGFLGRKLPVTIQLNSTSAFQFRFVTTAAAATAFDTATLKLVLQGIQIDKLDSFYFDNLRGNMLQKVPVTYYWTNAISGAASNTYPLFANPAAAQNLFSKTFPLSDIVAMSIHNIEVFFNQPDTAIEPTTIWDSRIQNVLQIILDEVWMYNADLQNILSLFAGFGVTLTTTPDTAAVNFMHVRQSKVLPVPINIAPNSNVTMNLIQPASSLGITGEFTVALRGVETRRVA